MFGVMSFPQTSRKRSVITPIVFKKKLVRFWFKKNYYIKDDNVEDESPNLTSLICRMKFTT